MSAHTPGPWETRRAKIGGDVAIVLSAAMADDGRPVILAECWQDLRRAKEHAAEEATANARLIAAAPDLLDALKAIDERLRECMRDPISAEDAYDSFYQDIVAEAIAKAEGT